MPLVLGVDPGFSSFGWHLVELAPNVDFLCSVRCGVIRTKKSSAKANTYASDDNFARARYIHQELQRVLALPAELASALSTQKIRAVCVEAMSFPRNSSAAAKVAMSWGVLAAVCGERNLPVLQASPQRVKQVLTGRKDASKEEVALQVAVRMHEVDAEVERSGLPKGEHEHVYDAAAVVLACMDSDVMRMLRNG